MRPLELANRYMQVLFSGEQLDDLYPLFTNDLAFIGPLFSFDTAQAYVTSLKYDSPSEFEYSILHSYEDDSSACLIYQFSKPGISVPMAQMFEISKDKICKIMLIFDSSLIRGNLCRSKSNCSTV